MVVGGVKGRWRRSEEEKEGAGQSYGREVILTVGHTLILDLQVLVGPRAGVGKDVGTRDHDALGPIVASGDGTERRKSN